MQTFGQISSWLLPVTCVYKPASNTDAQQKQKYWQSNLSGRIQSTTRQQFSHLMKHSFALGSMEYKYPHPKLPIEADNVSDLNTGHSSYKLDDKITVHYRLDLHKLQPRMAGLGVIVGMWLASNDFLYSWQVLALAIVSGAVAFPSMKAERVHHHLIGGLITTACFCNLGVSTGASLRYALQAVLGQPTPTPN